MSQRGVRDTTESGGEHGQNGAEEVVEEEAGKWRRKQGLEREGAGGSQVNGAEALSGCWDGRTRCGWGCDGAGQAELHSCVVAGVEVPLQGESGSRDLAPIGRHGFAPKRGEAHALLASASSSSSSSLSSTASSSASLPLLRSASASVIASSSASASSTAASTSASTSASASASASVSALTRMVASRGHAFVHRSKSSAELARGRANDGWRETGGNGDDKLGGKLGGKLGRKEGGKLGSNRGSGRGGNYGGNGGGSGGGGSGGGDSMSGVGDWNCGWYAGWHGRCRAVGKGSTAGESFESAPTPCALPCAWTSMRAVVSALVYNVFFCLPHGTSANAVQSAGLASGGFCRPFGHVSTIASVHSSAV